MTTGFGFGAGKFGKGRFGVTTPDTVPVIEALVWDLDLWDQDLVACAESDGRLLQWSRNPVVKAQVITNAPISCSGLVVTPQGALMAIGAYGDDRRIDWSDQGNNTVWTPDSTNQAGSVNLVTSGKLRRGIRVGNITLILTTSDAHMASYVGPRSIYRFDKVGADCGIIAKGAVADFGGEAAWWSQSGFWRFDGGAVRPINCDVWDLLTIGVNVGQVSKITGVHISAHGEVWWFYPSAGSTENDSYVYWDYRREIWGKGALQRLCGCEEGIFRFPLMMDANGLVYEHESGYDIDLSLYPVFARTGPFEIGFGDRTVRAMQAIPDEATAGETSLAFYGSAYPSADETLLQTVTLDGTGVVDTRFSARQISIQTNAVAPRPWRTGKLRLALTQGGRR